MGAGILLTAVIEIAQIPTARISDPRDLVANILGTIVGVLLVVAASAIRARWRALEPVPAG